MISQRILKVCTWDFRIRYNECIKPSAIDLKRIITILRFFAVSPRCGYWKLSQLSTEAASE